MAWGWRIPFLVSIVLVAVGLFIRLAVMESPAFKAVKESGGQSEEMPIVELVKTQKRDVLTAMGMRIAENGTFYIFTVFVLAYGEDTLKLSKNTMLTRRDHRRGARRCCPCRSTDGSPTASGGGRSTSRARCSRSRSCSRSSRCWTRRSRC